MFNPVISQRVKKMLDTVKISSEQEGYKQKFSGNVTAKQMPQCVDTDHRFNNFTKNMGSENVQLEEIPISEDNTTIYLNNTGNEDLAQISENYLNISDSKCFLDSVTEVPYEPCQKYMSGTQNLPKSGDLYPSTSSCFLRPAEVASEKFQKKVSESQNDLQEVGENHDTFLEDSDDSIKDKNYEPDSDEVSSENEDDITMSHSDNPAVLPHNRSSPRRPKKGRKRKFPEQDRAIRKLKKNSNQEHYSARGKLIKPKVFLEFVCTCSTKCHEKISVDERRLFFNHFWNLANYNVQTAFLSSCVREEPVKRKLVNAKNPNLRQFSRNYMINKKAVCRNMFTKTLRVSTKRINTALKKTRTLNSLDERGVRGGNNKMTEAQKTEVVNHINQFPRYKSHYCRAKSLDQEYLKEGTTLPLMYKLYKIVTQSKPVSFSSYKKVFLTEFNVKHKQPKKDTCNKCDALSTKLESLPEGEEKNRAENEHSLHLEEAETARNKMNIDMLKAESDEKTDTITFDMEKTLPLPRLTTNIIFYKRQLWLYNCGIYASKEKKSTFNIWVEGEAGRGAQEVGSCLRKYILNRTPDNVEHVILWSDSCGGQNRNIKMVLLLKCVLEESPNLKSIRLRFLVSGHSFLHNDSDFGDLECAIKKQTKIFSPEDYTNIMRTCRRKRPININRMEKNDFVSTKNLEKEIVNRKKSCEAEKINWLKIKEIKLVKEKIYSIFIKTHYKEEEDYKEINIKKTRKGRQHSQPSFSTFLEPLWPNGKPVAEPKLKDIRSYLHLIPPADQPFYKNLTGDESIEEDIDGYNGVLDFQPDT